MKKGFESWKKLKYSRFWLKKPQRWWNVVQISVIFGIAYLEVELGFETKKSSKNKCETHNLRIFKSHFSDWKQPIEIMIFALLKEEFEGSFSFFEEKKLIKWISKE